jgi:hypothetical protein
VTEKGFISFAAGERRKRKGQGWSPRSFSGSSSGSPIT